MNGKIIVLTYSNGAIDLAKALRVRYNNGWYAEFSEPIALNEQYFWPIYKHKGEPTSKLDVNCAYAFTGLSDVREATVKEVQFYHSQISNN